MDIDLPPSETQPPPPEARSAAGVPATPPARGSGAGAPAIRRLRARRPLRHPLPRRTKRAVPETLSPGNQVLYDRGYTLYYQGRYVDAEASFQRFLQANPTSELADNAQYWIGECRYARNDVKGALVRLPRDHRALPQGEQGLRRHAQVRTVPGVDGRHRRRPDDLPRGGPPLPGLRRRGRRGRAAGEAAVETSAPGPLS